MSESAPWGPFTHVRIIGLLVAATWTPIVLLTLTALLLATPCPTEDSTNCRWDAQSQGNGQGQSLLIIGEMVIPLP